ncbi:MAG: hypothetical protein HKN47_03355, partial [Pirellulaceae bacterium]|nr:hypothetical protein [Pirellulaceae bacterium]
FRADKVASRLQVGKTLRADGLIILALDRRSGQRVCRVVVCDARLGVRLWQGEFAFAENADSEALAKKCVAVVDEVRRRFQGGIDQIVAVPPFVAEDFVHRFDYMQTRLRDLISDSLMSRRGVAVVEIDEAKAIGQELQATLAAGIDRPIATVVKGSYNVTVPNDPDQRRIELMIELVEDRDVRQRVRKSLRIDDVGHWIATEFVPRLLEANQNRAPMLSPDVQKEMFRRHAQRFADLGDWERSTALREAVLVLDPNNVQQRALLISEYQYGFAKDIDNYWYSRWGARVHSPVDRERALGKAAEDYCLGLGHLAYLVRNQLIGRTDAIGLLWRQTWYKPQAVGSALSDPIKLSSLQPACVAQRKFLQDVFPLVVDLPQGRILSDHLSTPFYGARYVVTTHVCSDVAMNHYSEGSLASLGDLLLHRLPAEDRTSSNLLGLFSFTNVPKPGDTNYPAWKRLLSRLQNSDRETARLYGDFGVAMEARRSSRSTAGLERLLVETKRLGRTDEPLFDVLHLKLMRPKPQPSRALTAPRPRGDFGPLGRLRLEPIQLAEADENRTTPLRIRGALRCGDRDAYWTKERFYLMRQRGVLERVALTDAKSIDDLFWEVCWDGECIWLHVRGQGIIVLSRDGRRLGSFKKLIPPYGKGHKLLGLSPRRALMVGSFGDSNRAWAAILEINSEGNLAADIFFEAKSVQQGRTIQQASADASTVFRPVGLSQVRYANGKDYAIVERRSLSPLQIDLATLDVTAMPRVAAETGATTRSDLGFTGRLFFRDGRQIHARSGVATSTNSKKLHFHDDWLYRPGYVWMREHADSGRLERLQANTLPHAYWHLHAASSAHYGLVAFDLAHEPGPLSRVEVLQER